MDRYWAKIGIGAGAIFCVGMAGVTLAKKGVAELKTVASLPIAAALKNVPQKLLNFRLDGRRIGMVRSIDVSNEGDWSAKSVSMKVMVDDGRAPADLAQCQLASEDFEGRRDASFRCVSDSDVSDERLVQIGEVEFQPQGVTRPLFVAERAVRDLERSDLHGLKANLSSVDGNNVTGQAQYDLDNHHGKRERGTVKLDAGDGKALIEIRGEDGRELFHLRADDHGVSINAKDKRGTNLLRLLAGDAGVHLDVKADQDDRKAEKDGN